MRAHRKAPPEAAARAATRWSIRRGSLQLLGHSASSVFLAERDGARVVLRLTDCAHRTVEETEAELRFIKHVQACGVRVSSPLESDHGNEIEPLEHDGVRFGACVFSFAEGEDVRPGMPMWSDALLRSWGQTLAELHEAARSAPRCARWHWHEEHLIVHAFDIVEPGLHDIRDALEQVFEWLRALPRDAAGYGLCHADFGPGNFHYAGPGAITVFDFGNCCYHWFAWDLAIGCRWLQAVGEGAHSWQRVLDGYRSVRDIDPFWLDNLDQLIRFRWLYIFLDRAAEHLTNPSAESAAVVAQVTREVRRALRSPQSPGRQRPSRP